MAARWGDARRCVVPSNRRGGVVLLPEDGGCKQHLAAEELGFFYTSCITQASHSQVGNSYSDGLKPALLLPTKSYFDSYSGEQSCDKNNTAFFQRKPRYLVKWVLATVESVFTDVSPTLSSDS